MTRSEARELAFVLMFEKTFTEDSIQDIVEKSVEGRALEVDEFARALAEGCARHTEKIDAMLASCSQNWKLERVSRVALSTMRIATYEMLFAEEIPVSVSINEAIELTKKFAGPEDASYVNGVLGAAAKKLEKKAATVDSEP